MCRGELLSAFALASMLVACGGSDGADTVVYVDSAAAAGGDGSMDEPFRSVGEALAVDHVIEMVVIAAGDYPVPATWDFSAPLVIQGATGGQTRLMVEAGAERIEWTSSAALVVRNVSFASGLSHTGAVELQEVDFADLVGPALVLSGATARLFDVTIGDITEVDGVVGSGDGLVAEGGTLTMGGVSASVPDRALLMGDGVVATLSDLHLSGGSRSPLTVVDGAYVTAWNVDISATGIAIYVREASLHLTTATVDAASTSALMVSAGSTVTVSESTFTNCPQGHVSVLGQGVWIELTFNTFKNSTAAGCIFMAGVAGTVVIEDNTIETCAGSGISLSDTTGATIAGNSISNILPDVIFPELADGIVLIDAGATIDDNDIYGTAGAGISLVRGDGVISGNTLHSTASVAVTIVDPGSARVAVSGNQISDSVGVGVLVLGAAVDIDSNTIRDISYSSGDGFGDGIAFGSGANVVATNNSSTDNDRNGIVFLDGASGAISGNTCTGNTQYGILEFCSGAANDVDVGTNTLTGNTLGEQSLCSK